MAALLGGRSYTILDGAGVPRRCGHSPVSSNGFGWRGLDAARCPASRPLREHTVALPRSPGSRTALECDRPMQDLRGHRPRQLSGARRPLPLISSERAAWQPPHRPAAHDRLWTKLWLRCAVRSRPPSNRRRNHVSAWSKSSRRLDRVTEVLKASGARRVVDLGRLLERLVAEFQRYPRHRCRHPGSTALAPRYPSERQRARIKLCAGPLTYRNQRIDGFGRSASGSYSRMV